MRIQACLGALAGAVLLLSACGDDASDAGQCKAATSSTTTSSTSSGGGGGAGGGDEGGGGSGQGGGTSGKAIGEHCTAAAECASGFCLTEAASGWAQGYCTAACNTLITCPEGAECVFVGNDPFCTATCDPAGSDCGSAQSCVTIDDMTGLSVCGPACAVDADCPSLGRCDVASGLCVAPEDCGNAADDDGDGLVDCEDSDCAADCAAQIGATCGGATAAQGANDGDTSGGTALFAGSCTGVGAMEKLLSYTPATDGILILTLDSDTDQGVYVRTACDDGGTEIACVDAQLGGTQEVGYAPVTGGVPLTLFVDGYAAGEQGPFSLGVNLVQPGAEVEPNGDSATATATTAPIMAGAINPMGDEDWYAVDVPGPASSITVLTAAGGQDSCAPAGMIDTEVEIFDTDGASSLASGDDLGLSSYCSTATATDLVGGTYYVRVAASQQFCADCTFAYSVVIDVTN